MSEEVCNNILVSKEFPQRVIPLIQGARQSIDIIVFDWRWYPDQIGSNIQIFNNAIVKAVRNGLRCRAITNFNSNLKIFDELRIQTKKWNSKKTLHTKLLIIDNKIAILGSHNYTMNAFNLNHEVSILIDQPLFVARLKEYFNNLWQL